MPETRVIPFQYAIQWDGSNELEIQNFAERRIYGSQPSISVSAGVLTVDGEGGLGFTMNEGDWIEMGLFQGPAITTAQIEERYFFPDV